MLLLALILKAEGNAPHKPTDVNGVAGLIGGIIFLFSGLPFVLAVISLIIFIRARRKNAATSPITENLPPAQNVVVGEDKVIK
jgi:hypothetical protein